MDAGDRNPPRARRPARQGTRCGCYRGCSLHRPHGRGDGSPPRTRSRSSSSSPGPRARPGLRRLAQCRCRGRGRGGDRVGTARDRARRAGRRHRVARPRAQQRRRDRDHSRRPCRPREAGAKPDARQAGGSRRPTPVARTSTSVAALARRRDGRWPTATSRPGSSTAASAASKPGSDTSSRAGRSPSSPQGAGTTPPTRRTRS